MSNTTLIKEQPVQQQPNLLEPLVAPFLNPMTLGYFALVLVLLILRNGVGSNQAVLADARFANAAEIRRGTRIGQKQIIQGVIGRAAIELENIVLSDVQPAISVVGKSDAGKTRSVIDPAIKNGIDQGWTNLVFDVKGELIEKHAAYALMKGYEVYIYAPGFDYSDGFNFLKCLRDENDARTAEEIGKVLEANYGEPGERKDGFFSPQGVALLRLVFLMAKASSFPDFLSAWKFLALPDLPRRLKVAEQLNYLEEKSGFSLWLREATTAMRTMAEVGETVDGIVGTAMTNFQRMIDPKIVPCLVNDTIPLELKGKQIVFFQLDENAKSATAPLVAAAIHLLVTRNLNAQVKRDNTLGLFLDEFDSISLPEIKDYITKMRSYGLVALLAYQSEAQVNFRYTRLYAESILSSCGTKIYFNTGHHETAAKLSRALGDKEVKYNTESRTDGERRTRNTNEHIQTVPLLTAREINALSQGEAIIVNNPGFKYRPHKLKFKINQRNSDLWKETFPEIWFKQIKPYREKKIKGITGNMDVALINRAVLAEAMIPSVREIRRMQIRGQTA